ncbi:hypothetical protein ACS5PN_00525 [Roseateles sp. NT4]|uniref:hypothetical protein n=1 Tax=Roseateles sp. NT4 TaxID=3453715 RepID=UPI003EEEEB56
MVKEPKSVIKTYKGSQSSAAKAFQKNAEKTASADTFVTRLLALLACVALSLTLSGCMSAPKMSAGPMPAGFRLEPLVVQMSFQPEKVEVTTYKFLVTQWQRDYTRRFAAAYAERSRKESLTKFLDDARAASLPLRSSGQAGMTLSIRVTAANGTFLSYFADPALPNGKAEPDDFSMTFSVRGTLTDATGKELWWFKRYQRSDFGSPLGKFSGYEALMKELLQAMRADGLLPDLSPQQAPS